MTAPTRARVSQAALSPVCSASDAASHQALQDRCRVLLAEPTVEAQVRGILTDANHPAFVAMWTAVADQGYGKPLEPIELTGKEGGPILIQVVREGSSTGRQRSGPSRARHTSLTQDT